MSAQYNVFQQIFGLSLASNLLSQCKGTAPSLQQQLSEALPAALNQAGPGWKVVWGPVVWKHDDSNDSPLDNACFIAKNEELIFDDGISRPAFVIAIAATASQWTWHNEDFAIAQVVDLDHWTAAGLESISQEPNLIPQNKAQSDNALITNGFGLAVYQLLNNVPPEGSPGYPRNLPEFLLQTTFTSSSPTPKLVITGHSLGGALSPILAYTFLKANVLGPFSQKDVYVYPTAGPSPGNTTFAKKFASLFPPPTSASGLTGYQHWNCNIVCDLDPVPCAYCIDTGEKLLKLQRLLTIYGKAPGWVVGAVFSLAYISNGIYHPITSSLFNSEYPVPSEPFQTAEEWLDMAHLQHVDAYTREVLDMPHPPRGVCTQLPKEEEQMLYPVLQSVARAKLVHERGSKLAAEAGI
ncbi:Lipase (class 3) [Ceratobasidium sp. AG-Ba]|nr:Lipase (class 3) [Ceratobasidium sp. AG-Ba]